MKKTWIKVKRGLLQPEHRESIGIRIWLYMHMVDICDWDTGTITGWTDKDQADALEMPWRTVQRQRQELADAGYISCAQGFQNQTITITKWVNPRMYTGDIVENDGTQNSVGGTHFSVPIPPENCVPFLIVHIYNTYGVDVPENLQNDEFAEAWQEWEKYRREKKKTLTKTTVNKQIKFLAERSRDAAAILNQSMLNGWQGVFDLKGANGKPAAPSRTPSETHV